MIVRSHLVKAIIMSIVEAETHPENRKKLGKSITFYILNKIIKSLTLVINN